MSAGRLRRGLDADIRRVRADGVALSDSGVAALRVLADRIDALDRLIAATGGRPYDHVPLAGLIRQFDESYSQHFAAAATAGDPLTRALADFMAAEHGTTAPVGDPAERPAD